MPKEKTIKTIFIGTPDFGLPALKNLIKDDLFDVQLVITQPDKKVGRKQMLTPPPIKVEAQNNNIPVSQPEKISEIKEEIKKLNPDIVIVIAYGQIIPEDILNMPKYGCINVHGSLLPKYRGASCVNAPILNGDKESGVTIMKMDAKLDTGPILAQNKIQLAPDETAGSLYEKLSNLGANFLLSTLKDYISGKIEPKTQDDNTSSYVKELCKKDGEIDWNKSALEIERLVRGMNPWPGAHAQIQNEKLKIKNIKILEIKNETLKINKYKPGEFFVYDKKLAVQCGKDSLIIKTIQPGGRKQISGEDFLKGYSSLIQNY